MNKTKLGWILALSLGVMLVAQVAYSQSGSIVNDTSITSPSITGTQLFDGAERVIDTLTPGIGILITGTNPSRTVAVSFFSDTTTCTSGQVFSAHNNSTGSYTCVQDQGYDTIQDEGTSLTQRERLNIIGTGANCVDNPGNTRTDCTFLGYNTIFDEGTTLTQRSTLNMTGAGVTCTDSAGTTVCTIPGGGGSGYSTIQDEGISLTQRLTVNMTGSGVSCVDNSGALTTDCTITNTAGYNTIQDEGVNLTQRTKVNMTGSGIICTDNSGAATTDCTVTAGTVINMPATYVISKSGSNTQYSDWTGALIQSSSSADTIFDAVAAAMNSGDTAFIRNGVYDNLNNVTINDSNVKWICESRGVDIDGSGTNDIFQINLAATKSDITIQGCSFNWNGATSTGRSITSTGQTGSTHMNNIKILDNRFEENDLNSPAVLLENCDNMCIVDGNWFERHCGVGLEWVAVGGWASGNTRTYNNFFNGEPACPFSSTTFTFPAQVTYNATGSSFGRHVYAFNHHLADGGDYFGVWMENASGNNAAVKDFTFFGNTCEQDGTIGVQACFRVGSTDAGDSTVEFVRFIGNMVTNSNICPSGASDPPCDVGTLTKWRGIWIADKGENVYINGLYCRGGDPDPTMSISVFSCIDDDNTADDNTGEGPEFRTVVDVGSLQFMEVTEGVHIETSTATQLANYNLYSNNTNTAMTGTGFRTLANINFVAKMFSASQAAKVTFWLENSTSIDTTQVRVQFGGSTICQQPAMTANTFPTIVTVYILAESSTAQRCVMHLSNGNLYYTGTSAIDTTTADRTLNIAVDLNSDGDTLNGRYVTAGILSDAPQ